MKRILLIFYVLSLFMMAGCGSPPQEREHSLSVSVGLLRLTSSAPLFIGMEKGFFREEGLDIHPVWFDAAQPVAVAAASDTVDVGATGLTASVYNMGAAGRPVIICADKGRESPGYRSSVLVVRSDSDIRTLDDMKGRSFAVTTAGSSFQYMMSRMLENEGLSQDDITWVPLRSLGSVIAAVQTGKTDAAILNEPNGTKAERAGWGRIDVSVGDVLPYQTSAIFYSRRFAGDRETAVKFMKAYIRSCRWYCDHVLMSPDRNSPEFKEAIGLISRYTKTPEDDVIHGLPWIDRNGRLMDDDIQEQIRWYQDHLLVDGHVPEMTDMSYWEEAMKELP